MPGYDIENIIFKDPELLSKYTCPECKLLLFDAVQPSCGHWLCQSCADTIIARENEPSCPKEKCGERFSAEDNVLYFPDRFVRKDILGLSISCKFHHMGCDWVGKFGQLEEHIKTCDYSSIECEFCQKLFRSNEIESHKAGCLKVARKCPLSVIGCEVSKAMAVEELEEHLNLNATKHLEILVERMQSLEQMTSKRGRQEPEGYEDSGFGSLNLVEKDCATSYYSPTGSASPRSMQLPNIQRKSPFPPKMVEPSGIEKLPYDSDRKLAALKSDIKVSVIKELKTKDEEIAALKLTVAKLEKSVRLKTAEFEDRDFRLSLIENSNYDGTMVWKIPQFSQRMSDAQSGKYTSIFSLPFYTSRYGYKMCLRLYILGDGIGKGTYMSLFFVIMKGEFDNVLHWPFTHKVTFKLLNQSHGRDIVDTFQPDPMSSSFRKPKSDMNIASGCPRFVSHTELKTGGFIVDDTIFIKSIVDISSIKHP